MKAMILAAGRGERMRPLTDNTPKPLLKISGIPLIEHHLRKLAEVGITDIVINLAWLGDKIVEYFQDGSSLGVNICYSWERGGALETAGGIIKALPLLCSSSSQDNNSQDEPFLVVNGDIYIDYDYQHLPQLTDSQLAHLWLVENPAHNQQGDFRLVGENVQNLTQLNASPTYTFSGIGLYRPSFFDEHLTETVVPLAPLLRKAIDKQCVAGTLLSGLWTDVGTPERLKQLDKQLQEQ